MGCFLFESLIQHNILAVRRKLFFFFREITPRRWRVSSCNLKDGRMVGRRMIIVDMFFFPVEIFPTPHAGWDSLRFWFWIFVFCVNLSWIDVSYINCFPLKTSKNPKGFIQKKNTSLWMWGICQVKTTHQFLLATHTHIYFFFWGPFFDGPLY